MRPGAARARRNCNGKNRSSPTDRWHFRARRRPRRVRGREESTQFQDTAESVVKRRNGGTILVGIDTGGTFTDLVAIIGGEIRGYKMLSTPADPPQAGISRPREKLARLPPEAVTHHPPV